MPRERTPEEVRRLKAKGIFDVGTTYIKKRPFDKEPEKRFWDEEESS